MKNLNEYEPYDDDYSQNGNEETYQSQVVDFSLYNDGDDKKPKIILAVIGIVILLIILIIILFSCSKEAESKEIPYLKSVSFSNSTISPTFDKKVFKYEVNSEKDAVIVRCTAQNSNATVFGCNKQIYLSNVCEKHIIKVTLKDAGTKEYTFNMCMKNSDAPIIKEISVNPSEYTNSSVKVKVIVDGNMELDSKPYSFDDGATWQASNEYVVTENKSLKIRVKNKEGIETETIKEITNIDKVKPAVKIHGSIKSGVTTTSNVQLSAEVTPSTVISGYEYQWYKGKNKISSATKSSYLATESGEYKVVVTTGSGYKATSSVYKVVKKTTTKPSQDPKPPTTPNPPSNPDKEEYTLSITSVDGNPTDWVSKDVTLTINAKGSNGLHSQAYSFDGGKTFQAQNKKTFTSNQEITIVVRDKKNNKKDYKVKISKIDKTKPVINIIGDKYTNSQLTAAPTPVSPASGYKYQWYRDNTIINGATYKTYTPTVPGTYKVIVTTGAGISSEYNNIKISNKVTPTVSLTSSTKSGTWTKSDVTLNATIKNGTATKYEWYKGTSLYKDCTTENCKLTTTQNATYKVRAVTSSGKTAFSSTFTVKIDKTVPTSPTIKLSSNEETTSDVTFKITTGTDNDSGVNNVQYSYDKKTWTNYKVGSSITLLKTTGVKKVYARTVDKVGNVSKSASATGKCDKDKVSVAKDSNGCNTKGCWFKLKFSLVNTGLSGITKDKYEYAYWKATKTTDTTNKESSKATEKCGTTPPKDATIRTTTSAKTIDLYQKYNSQYYCFAVRPYRKTEISSLNRWTIQRKLAITTGSVKSAAYNGN